MRKYLLNLFILSACNQGVCIVTMLPTTEKGMTIRNNHRLTVFKADLGATILVEAAEQRYAEFLV